MGRSVLGIAGVALLGMSGVLLLGHLGAGANDGERSGVTTAVPSNGTNLAVAAPIAIDGLHAVEPTSTLSGGDSRLDNYRLERDSCCVGSE